MPGKALLLCSSKSPLALREWVKKNLQDVTIRLLPANSGRIHASRQFRQKVEELDPVTILALGKPAGELVGFRGLISKNRQTLVFYNEEIPCMVSYSPEAVLRDQRKKADWLEDLETWKLLTEVERGCH